MRKHPVPAKTPGEHLGLMPLDHSAGNLVLEKQCWEDIQCQQRRPVAEKTPSERCGLVLPALDHNAGNPVLEGHTLDCPPLLPVSAEQRAGSPWLLAGWPATAL